MDSNSRLPVMAAAPFPLTLREREQLAVTRDDSSRAGYADRLRTILPLPGGEGRGVGHANVAGLKVREVFMKSKSEVPRQPRSDTVVWDTLQSGVVDAHGQIDPDFCA